MNKENWQWVVLIIVVLGLFGLGAIVVNQNAQMAQISRTMITVSSQVQDLAQKQNPQAATNNAPVAQDGYKTLTQENVVWNGNVYQFVHRCKGEVKVAEEQATPFCIGQNQLAVIDPSSNVKILKTDTIIAAADAPVLLSADLIPSTQKNSGNVLLSYSVETCATTNDCGAGMPTNYVRFVYNLGTQTLRGLKAFPNEGKPAWNPSGTKAIFYPSTCGGAGCGVVSLGGYDLSKDEMKSVTNVEAAANENGDTDLVDAGGKKLPVWTDIYWKNDSDFVAIVQNPDLTKKQVSGKY